MNRPALIPHNLKPLFHNKKSCIDVREGVVHSLKANTNNRTWHNEINLDSASISINPRTRRENRLVFTSKEPFHVLSFGCGADTYYWGRYKCVSKSGTFELEYVDEGLLSSCVGSVHRSKLETKWSKTFEKNNIDAIFEPATMKLSDNTEYTPDFWLPESNTFIEIKGPNPSKREFTKCVETRRLGFKIKMFHGSPTSFDVYDWSEKGKMKKSEHDSYYRYLHPSGARKRRRIHNVAN
jgi:hypothetical protein